MGAVLRVQVPPKGDHPNRSEPQLQEGDRLWEGSGEPSRGSMYKKCVRGDAERGEQANDCEASMVKAQAAYTQRPCGEGRRSYLGRSRFAPEGATQRELRSEKSAEVVVATLKPAHAKSAESEDFNE